MPSAVLAPTPAMQPTLVGKPFHRPGSVYEEKYDGWRILRCEAAPVVTLISQPGMTILDARRVDTLNKISSMPER
jgi:hypothetical protein